MATPSLPVAIPGSSLMMPPPAANLGLPSPSRSPHPLRTQQLLTVDTMSPVTQNGSYEFDRIIKSGTVLKRTRKTKSWKPVYLVLRPQLLSIYRDSSESKLRHQIHLADLTAVARQKDPKRRKEHVFGLFTPARNFHVDAQSDQEAQQWVDCIRQAARIGEDEEREIELRSPTSGEGRTYQAFGRPIDSNTNASQYEDRGGYSSSDAEVMTPMHPPAKQRDRGDTAKSSSSPAHFRRPSAADYYSGPDAHNGSYSDFSDSAGPARMSALSLSAFADGPTPSAGQVPIFNTVYGNIAGISTGATDTNNSVLDTGKPPVNATRDEERVVYHSWLYLLNSRRGVRQWKKVWMVLRPRTLILYKNEEEYTATLVLPFSTIIDVVEIDAISRSKSSCMQVLSEERNYRFCAMDEESLARWLGAFRSLLSKRKAREGVGVAVQPPTPVAV